MSEDQFAQVELLSRLSQLINQADDVLLELDELLLQVTRLAGLSAAWLFLREETRETADGDGGYELVAQANLPPELGPDNSDIWQNGCECLDVANMARGKIHEHLSCRRFAEACPGHPELCDHHSLPLCSGSRILGVLNVVGPEGTAIDQATRYALTVVGAHLGTALDRSRMAVFARERWLEEQAALLKLSSQLLSRSNLDDVVSYLVEEITKLFDVDACSLLLPDERPGYLIFRASSGWKGNPAIEKRRVASNHRSSFGTAMQSQAPVLSAHGGDRENIPEMTLAWLEEEEFEGLAIVPLIVEGQSIGALALATREPREFSQDEIRILQVMANQAGIAIMNAELQKEEIRLQRLQKELAVGRHIQHSLLPSSSPVAAGWQFSDIYRPARVVGGDLYDYFELPFDHHRLGLVVGDVADKGIPAALFMAASRTLIRSVAMADLTPASALVESNRLILQDSSTDLFLSAFYAILDTKSGRLTYANAGHNPPVVLQAATGETVELSAKGIVLCVLEEIALEERFIDVASGDVLILYTDGVTEAMNANNEEFGIERLKHVVAASSKGSAAQILEAIVDSVDAFVGDMEQPDDQTLIVVKRV